MTLYYGPFNSINRDRAWRAEDFADYLRSFIGNGVFPNPGNNLQVVSAVNMTTAVKPGKGWINGYYLNSDTDYSLSHDVADGVLQRIDRVVMRLNLIDRIVELKVIKGTPAASPVAPALVRSSDYYDLGLANVTIPNGSTQISQANISDTRMNSAVCGIVSGLITQVDPTAIFDQYQAWYDQTTSQTAAELQAFIDSLTVILEGNVAANLASRILALETRVNNGQNFKLTADNGNARNATNISTVSELNATRDPGTYGVTLTTAEAALLGLPGAFYILEVCKWTATTLSQSLTRVDGAIRSTIYNRTSFGSNTWDPFVKQTDDRQFAQSGQFGVVTGTNIKSINLPITPNLIEGLSFRFKNNVANSGASTLNVNSLGAKPILRSNGVQIPANWLKANYFYVVIYDGTNFILQDEGGGGDAVAGDLLFGRTATSDVGDLVGTMPNRGVFNLGLGVTVPPGYYSGGVTPSGKRSANGVASSINNRMIFNYKGGSGTANLPYIEVSGINFLPSIIIITANNRDEYTIYNRYADNVSSNSIKIFGFNNSTINSAVGNYANDLGAAFVNGSGFRMPVTSVVTNYTWRAYE